MLMNEIIDIMEKIAPSNLAMVKDNIGLSFGSKNTEVKKILVALDAVDAVVDEAIELNAKAIITHHPMIFSPINQIDTDTSLGKRIQKMSKYDICHFVAHTNYDAVESGVNDIMFEHLGLNSKGYIMDMENTGVFYGRTAELPSTMKNISLESFAKFVGNKLNLDTIQYCGDPKNIVKKLAISCGSAAKEAFFEAAVANQCDTYITGDIKYHMALYALDLGLNLVDAPHYYAENLSMAPLAKYLRQHIGSKAEVVVSSINASPFNRI